MTFKMARFSFVVRVPFAAAFAFASFDNLSVRIERFPLYGRAHARRALVIGGIFLFLADYRSAGERARASSAKSRSGWRGIRRDHQYHT